MQGEGRQHKSRGCYFAHSLTSTLQYHHCIYRTKMGSSLVLSPISPLKLHQLPNLLPPLNFNHIPKSSIFSSHPNSLKIGNFGTPISFKQSHLSYSSKTSVSCTKAVFSETQYPKVGAQSTGPISASELLQVVEKSAKVGAQVIMEAVNKPRKISYKGLTDLVTETDKMSEAAILEVVRTNFKDHLILGEEGGIIGDSSSDYLWCIDPLDGTTNFAHGYPSFAVSVGVLFRGRPVAAAVVEFVGGAMCWNTRTFTATAGGGAFCNGEPIQVSTTDLVERSLLVTGFGYEHDDAWLTNINLFKEFTDVSRGVRRLGAAAVDMCHVAIGIVDAYWEYRLKPWDMAAGVLIVEEAGGAVTRMDGGKFCVYDRSVLVSNGSIHPKLLEKIGPATERLKEKGIDFSWWYKPENYRTDL